MLEAYPENDEVWPRYDDMRNLTKHNSSVAAAKLEQTDSKRDGSRIASVAEFVKQKSAMGQMDFTEVGPAKPLAKQSSHGNLREQRLFQANLTNFQNQNGAKGRKRRNIQNLLAQNESQRRLYNTGNIQNSATSSAQKVQNSNQKVSNVRVSRQEFFEKSNDRGHQQRSASKTDADLMNANNALGGQNDCYNDNTSNDDANSRGGTPFDNDRKSRSRSRQQQPRQTNLAKSPSAFNQIQLQEEEKLHASGNQALGGHQAYSHANLHNLQLLGNSGLQSIEEVVTNRRNSGRQMEQLGRKT